MLFQRPQPGAAVLSALLLGGVAHAYQPDQPFVEAQKKHAQQWAQEDAALDERLAELEQKYGKRPNIVYILADDIGWGELGSYSGGILRGTPTPNLDAMAQQGRRADAVRRMR